MDLHDVIIRPLVTEKGTHQMQFHSEKTGSIYAFEVNRDATKPQIRDAVEKIYQVNVIDVRTQVRKKPGRRFRLAQGRPHKSKKAVVVVDKNSNIDLF